MVTLLVLLTSGLHPFIAQTDPIYATVRVRAYADERVDATLVQRAQQVAGRLLASAGLVTAWRVCDAAESCSQEDSPVPEIAVIFLSEYPSTGRAHCGVAAMDERFHGTVMVSVRCAQNVASRLSKQLATRSHPMLAMGRHDDIVGASVAHEIGHVLGLPHAPFGLMRARLESDDILALRQGRLVFSARESATMRQSARPTSGDDLRAARR
jgi:hypothetical protein